MPRTTPVSPEPGFTLGQPQKLFEAADQISPYSNPSYGVSTDGQRFVTIAPATKKRRRSPRIHVVQNWYEEFRDREQN